jgi:hypothetical protein
VIEQFRERTNLRFLVSAIGIAAIGVGLLLFSEASTYLAQNSWLKSALSNLGGLLVASVSIATIWELYAKRAFLDEMLSTTRLVSDIRSSGLSAFSMSPVDTVDFPQLLQKTKRLDMSVTYGDTWRARYYRDLKQLAERPGTMVRVVLPNPENPFVMQAIAQRLGTTTPESVAGKIRAAVSEYRLLFEVAAKDRRFSIWFHDDVPMASYYRFDTAVVAAFHHHSRGRGDTPTLLGEAGGSLFNYVDNEFNHFFQRVGPFPAIASQQDDI